MPYIYFGGITYFGMHDDFKGLLYFHIAILLVVLLHDIVVDFDSVIRNIHGMR
jgi:hypothetical protein